MKTKPIYTLINCIKFLCSNYKSWFYLYKSKYEV